MKNERDFELIRRLREQKESLNSKPYLRYNLIMLSFSEIFHIVNNISKETFKDYF